ncbi:MAG TPA: VOC family protein [Verrucomicrobiae bacterium]|nr:VOC family protein [Verrucomicrobiae bacterium]
MRILELNHIALHVRDVEKSCEFYARVLQLQPLPRPAFDFPGAWFRLGAHQELHIIGERKEPVLSQNRGNHFALQAEDLQPWLEHFQNLGLPLRGPVRRPDGATQVFLKDVDGHVVELFTPPPRGKEC